MNFIDAKKHLQNTFDNNHFTQHVKEGRIHTTQVLIEKCTNNTEISISFPGYKASVKENKTVYDYRVDIKKNGVQTALSHANIITDIYNKIVNGGIPITLFYKALIEMAKNGTLDILEIEQKLAYKPYKPSGVLIERVRNAHRKKQYNETGNSFDLTLEELFLSIKWIALQEDINYPMPRFEGRKMPFARYVETIFITQNNTHSLEEVIERTLSHKRPSPWKEIDYSFLKTIS